jgi:hypothetical protein
MRALLDVNVIIALLDPDHAFHERAHAWWAANMKRGWASCPLTENGVVRIMSNPGYSQKTRFTPGDLIDRLRKFARQSNHEFWPDGISLRDEKIFAAGRIHSSRQLTDLYLLALAVEHHGRLVTFDRGIPLSGVHDAKAANLCAA